MWGLLLVVIPILLHLFNFRKYKTVRFSNINLLKEVKNESKKARKIKNWLVLIFRGLFVVFLVLAFALPYSGQKINNKSNIVSIYVDNSFSMDNEGVEGNKLNNAKAFADQIVKQLPSNSKIHLVTNDYEGKHQNKFSKITAQDEISKISPSHLTRSFKSVLERQSIFLQGNKNRNNQIYWISDFQQLKINEIANPDSFKINLALLKSSYKLNVSLDSVWFESPVRKKIGTENLKFNISNFGKQTLKNQKITLSINNRINSFSIPDLAPGRSTFNFEFQIPNDSLIKGIISIEDQSLLFDNELLFSYLIPRHQKVCLITNENSDITNVVKKVFKGDSSVKLSVLSPFEIDYQILGEQNLILLGELDKIDQNLAMELLKISKTDKVIGVIPGKNTQIVNYNDAFTLWGDVKLKDVDTSTIKIGYIQKYHSFFNGVFQKDKKTKNSKESFPTLHNHFRLSTNLASETIILKEDGSPFFVTQENFYYLASGISQSQSDFSQKALIVPLLYQMIFKSINTTPIQYVISPKTKLTIPSSLDRNVSIKSENLIAKLNVNNHTCFIPSNFKKGYYELMDDKCIKGSFALNFDRTENLLIKNQINELNELKKSPFISGFEVLGNLSKNSNQLLNSQSTYWLECIIIAILCLFLEMILIRLKI